MKFIVDKLPNNSGNCIFSEWHAYPPIMKEAGYYRCIKCQKECNLTRENTECYLLKEGKKMSNLKQVIEESFTQYSGTVLQSHTLVDARPTRRGKWEDDWETGCSVCSVCGEGYLWEDFKGVAVWNFCPNCGAYMREIINE